MRDIAKKERHILFVEAVKRVQKDVNMKIEELHSEMAKEVVKLDHNYSNLNTEVNIVVATVTKVVELHSSLRKVISMQIPTSLPKSTVSTTATTMTSKPLTKGVVIGSFAGGSSSKPPPSTEEMKVKGKGIHTNSTEEEKKIALEKEMDRQRQIHSILRQRRGDPPGLEKGDPTKPYCYETIEQTVSLGNMHDFLKVPKKSHEIENPDFNQLDFPINHMSFISA